MDDDCLSVDLTDPELWRQPGAHFAPWFEQEVRAADVSATDSVMLFRHADLRDALCDPRLGAMGTRAFEAMVWKEGAFVDWLKPLCKCEWVVYAKRPFAGPEAVLAYLSRYTHRVAIANSRLIALDEQGVSFRYKDYRAKGRTRYKTMTLSADEFIRRFLLHVLPSGFHRIRHYGLIANTGRRNNLARARALLAETTAVTDESVIPVSEESSVVGDHGIEDKPTYVCPDCGAPMTIIDTFIGGQLPRAPPRLSGGSS